MFERTSRADGEAREDLKNSAASGAAQGPSGAEKNCAADRPGNKKETFETPYAELKLPQGLEGCEENFAAFKKLARELKLPAETAKKLMEWEARTAEDGRQNALVRRGEILQRWTEQTREMFGSSYPKELARALAAADRFGGPELRTLLDATGLGSHPAVVKTFHEISRQIGEDESVAGRARGNADKTFAEALYGKAQ